MIKSMTIKGRRYKIKSGCDGENMGEIDFTKREIYLSKEIKSQEDLYSTLLHEMMHAILHEAGLTQIISGDNQELIVENISTAIYQEFFSKRGIKKWSTSITKDK